VLRLIALFQSRSAVITSGAMIDSISERDPSFTVVILVSLRKSMMTPRSIHPTTARRVPRTTNLV
jgi:hypothetical protein